MESFPKHIHRVFKPSEMDQSPYGTLCIVEGDEYYIQVSKNEEKPDWYQISNKEDGIKLIKELLKNHSS